MAKRPLCVHNEQHPSARHKARRVDFPEEVINASDFLTLEPLPRARWQSLDVLFEHGKDGVTVFLRSSLRRLLEVAELEGVPALNPYTQEPLKDQVKRAILLVPSSVSRIDDPLRFRESPSMHSTKRLIVDVCVRLAVRGYLLDERVILAQRTGRMKRLHAMACLLFSRNFDITDRLLLAPPEGALPAEAGWANWATWGQCAMLTLATCAGERSKSAHSHLRSRGVTVVIAALSAVIPEVHAEFGERIDLRGAFT